MFCVLQCAVLFVAVDINGEEDESNDCGDEWNGTQDVIIISVTEFQNTAFDVLDNCHCCALSLRQYVNSNSRKVSKLMKKRDDPKIEIRSIRGVFTPWSGVWS